MFLIIIRVVPNREKLLFGQITIIGDIVWPNRNRILIVAVIQYCHPFEQYIYAAFLFFI